MTHNANDYPDPDTFEPERFLREDGKVDQEAQDRILSLVFGFGRRYVPVSDDDSVSLTWDEQLRVCAGQFFARDVQEIFMASLLHVFEIKAGLDDDGQQVILTNQQTDEAFS